MRLVEGMVFGVGFSKSLVRSFNLNAYKQNTDV